MTAVPIRAVAAPLATRFRGRLGWRRLLIWATALVLAIAVAVTAVDGWKLARAMRTNADIHALVDGGKNVEVPADARPELAFARLTFLLQRDRLDEAQPVLSHIMRTAPRPLVAAALYNMANSRLHAAFGHLEGNEFDAAAPLVRLAKDGYRRALTLEPEMWDAKYNLDIAMRLVRDFPKIDQEGDEEVGPELLKNVWIELPGLPKGLP
ncbi:hypothetical protein MWN34_13640 [Ancylobacter sp. 6x-1]|uniref:MxaK protein n=1 Tax=Ancylobacter crimeensis TaxID=2579147 RepID=A0ABT0DDA4_9HYPH|nr:hypothetical protein [Ancylobacter crimeensis]MCK0197951.1 hypothetical protein [Ancylobacter crimeensis]